jgi:hypothetical protein
VLLTGSSFRKKKVLLLPFLVRQQKQSEKIKLAEKDFFFAAQKITKMLIKPHTVNCFIWVKKVG